MKLIIEENEQKMSENIDWKMKKRYNKSERKR